MPIPSRRAWQRVSRVVKSVESQHGDRTSIPVTQGDASNGFIAAVTAYDEPSGKHTIERVKPDPANPGEWLPHDSGFTAEDAYEANGLGLALGTIVQATLIGWDDTIPASPKPIHTIFGLGDSPVFCAVPIDVDWAQTVADQDFCTAKTDASAGWSELTWTITTNTAGNPDLPSDLDLVAFSEKKMLRPGSKDYITPAEGTGGTGEACVQWNPSLGKYILLSWTIDGGTIPVIGNENNTGYLEAYTSLSLDLGTPGQVTVKGKKTGMAAYECSEGDLTDIGTFSLGSSDVRGDEGGDPPAGTVVGAAGQWINVYESTGIRRAWHKDPDAVDSTVASFAGLSGADNALLIGFNKLDFATKGHFFQLNGAPDQMAFNTPDAWLKAAIVAGSLTLTHQGPDTSTTPEDLAPSISSSTNTAVLQHSAAQVDGKGHVGAVDSSGSTHTYSATSPLTLNSSGSSITWGFDTTVASTDVTVSHKITGFQRNGTTGALELVGDVHTTTVTKNAAGIPISHSVSTSTGQVLASHGGEDC